MTDDLEITCRVCNALDYVEKRKGVRGFTVTYTKPVTDQLQVMATSIAPQTDYTSVKQPIAAPILTQ